MQKGKYGVCLWFYALVAFILAFLGQVLLGGLLLGFVIVAEKNEWLTRQVIQAFFLTIIVSVINAVLDLLNIFGNVPIVGHRYRCGVQRNFHHCFHCCAGVRHYRYGQGGKGTGSQYALAEQAG